MSVWLKPATPHPRPGTPGAQGPQGAALMSDSPGSPDTLHPASSQIPTDLLRGSEQNDFRPREKAEEANQNHDQISGETWPGTPGPATPLPASPVWGEARVPVLPAGLAPVCSHPSAQREARVHVTEP